LYDGREKKFKRITVDDYLPADGGKPIFANPNGSELWVLLLEKAMAKLFGTYGKLDGGTHFTGFTSTKVQILTQTLVQGVLA
jgi:calpain-15